MMRADRFNPFPGLRSFEPDEDHLFFGREKQIEELLRRLRHTRFLSVVGASGTGKSSLVRSGLIPSLYGGYMVKAGSTWRVALLRPGGDPIGNLAAALDAPGVLDSPSSGGLNRPLLEATLRRSALGLSDAIKNAHIPPTDNLLVVVDQFEELFRFKQAAEGARARDESVGFVKLLLEGAQQGDQRLYVVLTMRSEFIGHCTEFPGLAEAANEGQYLIPRMTRDEVRLAITGPVAVGGGEIAPRLVTRLLNDVGDHADQLPILQHALMRTWNHWEQHSRDGHPIDLQDYEAIGTMTDALSRHAEEAYGELTTERSRQIAERVFKALTETNAESVGLRRPCSVGELCQITGATPGEVVDVIDRFRAPGRSFLMPPIGVSLDDRSIVDLSHESLMRLWTRLIGWTNEEVRSAEIYRRLNLAARLYGQGEAGLWRDPELQVAVNWRQTHHPTAAWATRYAPEFDRAIAFLAESQKAHDREVADKERQLIWTRRVAAALATLCVISIGSGIYAFRKRGEAVASAERALAASTAARQAQEAAVTAKGVADSERQNAETRKQEADAAKEAAISEQRRAQLEAIRASAEENKAQQQARVALEQRGIAEAQTREAEKRRTEALESESRAEAARVEAERQSQRAVAEKTQADRARAESDRLARLTLARALAARVVGQWDAGQRQLAALLARQAFLLTKDNGGDTNDADIYSALRTSLSLLAPNYDRSFQGHEDAVRAIQLTPDGTRLITGSDDGKVRLFDVGGSAGTATILGAAGSPIRSLAIDSTGNLLAAGGFDGSIRLWDLRRPKAPPASVTGHTGATSALAFDPRSRLVSAGFDGRIKIWEKELTGPGRPLVDNHRYRILSIALSPDGNTLAMGSDGGGLLLLDLREISNPTRALDENRRVSAVAFSPDGRLVVGGTQDGRIMSWDVASQDRQTVRTAAAHAASVTGLSFGQTLLASSSLDGTVKLWRVQAGLDLDHPIVLSDHGSWVWAVALSPRDDRVFSAAADRRVQSRMTQTSSIADEICAHVSANLSSEDWNEYVSDTLPYQPTCPGRPVRSTAR